VFSFSEIDFAIIKGKTGSFLLSFHVRYETPFSFSFGFHVRLTGLVSPFFLSFLSFCSAQTHKTVEIPRFPKR